MMHWRLSVSNWKYRHPAGRIVVERMVIAGDKHIERLAGRARLPEHEGARNLGGHLIGEEIKPSGVDRPSCPGLLLAPSSC